MVQARIGRKHELNLDGAVQPAERVEVGVALPTAVAPPVSGLYKWQVAGGPQGSRAEFRLDVDGMFPLMAVSGSEIGGLTQRVDWVARPLIATSGPTGTAWSGPINYKNGATFLFQHTAVGDENRDDQHTCPPRTAGKV